MQQITKEYGLVYNDDGNLCTTVRDDVYPFNGVKSLQIETQTVNLLYNHSSTPLLSGTYWGVQGGSSTGHTGVKIIDLGHGKIKITTSQSLDYQVLRLYCDEQDLVNGDTYAQSLYFEVIKGSKPTLDWCDTNLSGNNYTNNRVYIVSSRSTYDSTYRFLDINIQEDSEIILWSPQVEHYDFPTSFVAGSRPEGKITYPVIKSENIVVNGWVKFITDENFGTGGWARVVSFEDSADNNRISFVYYRISGNSTYSYTFGISIKINGSDTTIYTTNKFAINQWHFFTFILDNGIYKAYIYAPDGTNEIITNPTDAKTLKFNDMIIGWRKYSGGDQLHGLISNLYIGKYRNDDDNIIWTEDFIRKVYESKKPFKFKLKR